MGCQPEACADSYGAAQDGGASRRGCLAASLPEEADGAARRAAHHGDGGGEGEAADID